MVSCFCSLGKNFTTKFSICLILNLAFAKLLHIDTANTEQKMENAAYAIPAAAHATVATRTPAVLSAPVDQPAVPRDAKLLMAAYDYDGLKLDLWGYADYEEGCAVEAVTVHGSSVDISVLLTLAQMTRMGWDVDNFNVQMLKDERDEDRRDRADDEYWASLPRLED